MFSVVGSNGHANDGRVSAGRSSSIRATHSVRRISLQAEEMPKEFPTKATVMGVDYDYVVINGHDYLMPVSAEVTGEAEPSPGSC